MSVASPPAFSNLRTLSLILAVQQFLRLPPDERGKPYGPAYFRKFQWAELLQNRNRRVTLRLAVYGRCISCGTPLSASSTGDHLIPLAEGGPDDASNYIPLCKRCNASKGKRDFLEWWLNKHKEIRELPAKVRWDVLTAYARLRFQSLDALSLDAPAPQPLIETAWQMGAMLPTMEHLVQLYEAIGVM